MFQEGRDYSKDCAESLEFCKCIIIIILWYSGSGSQVTAEVFICLIKINIKYLKTIISKNVKGLLMGFYLLILCLLKWILVHYPENFLITICLLNNGSVYCNENTDQNQLGCFIKYIILKIFKERAWITHWEHFLYCTT